MTPQELARVSRLLSQAGLLLDEARSVAADAQSEEWLEDEGKIVARPEIVGDNEWDGVCPLGLNTLTRLVKEFAEYVSDSY